MAMSWNEFISKNRSVEKVILHHGGIKEWMNRSYIADLKKWCENNDIEYPANLMEDVDAEEAPKKAVKRLHNKKTDE